MKNIIVLIATLTLISCTSTEEQNETTATSTPANPTWTGQMLKLSNTLSELVPYLFDDKKFFDPDNKNIILKKAKELTGLAHTLDQKKLMNTPTDDPAVVFFAAQFQDDLKRAVESLETDHKDYARSVLKTSISYCISCHTRSDQGRAYPLIAGNDSFVKSLSGIEKARYYTATRQFDAAIKEFIGVLEDPETGKVRPFDIEKAARNALALAVRVKKDPVQAQRIAEDVIKKPETPLFVRNDAQTWLSSIQEWKGDLIKGWKLVGKQTHPPEATMIRKVKELIKKAESIQRYPADMKADIHYLRATAIIHEYFDIYKNTPNRGEMLYLAGRSYEALRDLGFWTLHELYYERCVREAPHTALSFKCYTELEQSVLLGYSGSAGLFLPISVRKQLQELRSLAMIK